MRSIIYKVYYNCVNFCHTNVRSVTILSIRDITRLKLGIDEFGAILSRDNILTPIAVQTQSLR